MTLLAEDQHRTDRQQQKELPVNFNNNNFGMFMEWTEFSGKGLQGGS